MTLQECKNGMNVNKVRFFDTEQLSSACEDSWDRVKIVCTQPYIKQAKFGLSFVTFHSKDIPQKEPEPKPIQSQIVQLGSFTLRNDDGPDDLSSAGRLFSKRHENKDMVKMPESPINRLLAIHKKNLETNKNTDFKQKDNPTLNNQKNFKSPKDSVKPKKTDSNVKKTDVVKSPSIQNKGTAIYSHDLDCC